ncbi:MAG: hypothetical protein ACUZ8I_13260 [Candidatus Scalindua sp.]
MPIISLTESYRDSEGILKKWNVENIMTYKKRGNKLKQIFVHLIAYSIYVLLGSTALFFFHKSWNTTLGNLIIFMSPYIIINAIIYSYRVWGNKRQDTQEC